MDLQKSPFFKADTYTQDVQCWYCGLLNKVEEHRINCEVETDRFQTLLWYTWCQACYKKMKLKETIYKLVRERLIQRTGCFQSPHKCTDTKLYVSIENFQEKCKDHENCWEYYCKKCCGVFHCSKMPSEVRKRMEEITKEEKDVATWEEEPSVENDRLLD